MAGRSVCSSADRNVHMVIGAMKERGGRCAMFRCYCCLQEEVAWVDLNFEFNFFYEHMGERGEVRVYEVSAKKKSWKQ